MSTLRTHKDYVACLAYSAKRNQLVSGGYDDQIFLWDVKSLATLTVDNSTVTCLNLQGFIEKKYNLLLYHF
jgi:WD40 repeat protein